MANMADLALRSLATSAIGQLPDVVHARLLIVEALHQGVQLLLQLIALVVVGLVAPFCCVPLAAQPGPWG